MLKYNVHSWDMNAREAIALQKNLAQSIVTEGEPEHVRFIAGVDFALSSCAGYGRAAVVIMEYPSLKIVEICHHEEPLTWPYIPGLLSWREIPCILGALARVTIQPQLILVDGMGIAHPRKLGIAAHLGLWVSVPTIGCGKKRLTGTYDATSLAQHAGSQVPLFKKDEVIGAVVRTRAHVNPLFISVGNGINLTLAIRYVLACTQGYRLPEPIRYADKVSKHKTQ